MIDIILYDLDGAYCPPNLSAPVGGSEAAMCKECFSKILGHMLGRA